MPLTPGTQLGPYEIVSALGAGGMGEVYRAKDTRLGREVAIKVLPSHLASNPELQQRLDREAKSISSLSHPNICSLFDVGHQDGTDYLVMELLDGETLEQRLSKGPLPTKAVLEYGVQIAEALDRAHKSGIIHRDLKPGNIMLTKAGAKLMDFGLSKPPVTALGVAASSDSPTMPAVSKPLTQEGTIVGTFQYMAPEQLEGREADARSDIFAFGAVLYEMLTAQRAFPGKSSISVMSAILEKEPEPISKLVPLAPLALEHVVERALAKNPDQRWQGARDVCEELKWIAVSGSQAATPVLLRRNKFSRARSAAALLVAALAIAALAWFFYTSRPGETMVVASMLPPAKWNFLVDYDDSSGPMVISPDQTTVVFTAHNEEHGNMLWVRKLDEKDAHPVEGTENAIYPFWSPDSRSVGFFSSGYLRRVDVTGGPVTAICPVIRPRGGSWSSSGTILFAPDTSAGIFRVSTLPGSLAQPVTAINPENTTSRWPVWMPDGKHFIYLGTNHSDSTPGPHNGIYFASADGKENRLVLAAESNAVFANGYLLWVQNGGLLAQAFDPRSGTTSGEPISLFANVSTSPSTWRANIDAGERVLLYHDAGNAQGFQLRILARDGKVLETLPDSSTVNDVRFSPDGHKLALQMGLGSTSNIWVYDLESKMRNRLTFERSGDGLAWSPDSKEILFTRWNGKFQDIYLKSLSGADAQPLYTSQATKKVDDISHDRKYLLFEQALDSTPATVWIKEIGTAAPPRPLVPGSIGVHMARFSPDDKWIVYISPEGGSNQMYVTSVANGGKKQLTTTGAWGPHWSSDGKHIYFNNNSLSAAELPVKMTPTVFEVGQPVILFKIQVRASSFWSQPLDAAPDGKTFAAVDSVGVGDNRPGTLVLNWVDKAKKH